MSSCFSVLNTNIDSQFEDMIFFILFLCHLFLDIKRKLHDLDV